MKKILITLTFLFYINLLQAQYITIDDQRTAQDLVENILLQNTGCASVSNFSVSGGNFGTGENSYGYFNGAGTNFPFEEGVILSTGKANEAPGPNANTISGTANNWQGLDTASANILQESNTNNATYIEFDFTPLVGYMSFEYIFASEEYKNNLMCNYSDVFGFLLKKASEPDSSYINIALIPNTDIPVKVTTVHPQGDCPPQHEEYFDTINGYNAPIDYLGQTVALTAESDVEPNVTYHIKLIIADDQDDLYDSAVFLKAGSFNIGTNLGEDRLIATNNPVCGTETITLDAGYAVAYQWYKDGVLLSGETNQELIVDGTLLGNGNYKVILDLGGGCISEGSIDIEFAPNPVVTDATVSECIVAGTNVATFDLTDVSLQNTVTNNNPNLSMDSFYASMDDYNADPQVPIANPNAFEIANSQSVFAKVVDVTTGCYAIAEITLNVGTDINANINNASITSCRNPLTNMAEFDLTDANLVDYITIGNPNLEIQFYYNSLTDFNSDPQIPIDNPAAFETAIHQPVYAQVVNINTNCYELATIDLDILEFPETDNDETIYYCTDTFPQTITLSSSNHDTDNLSNYQYYWSTDEITESIAINAIGDYSVTVTNVDGCAKTRTIHVLESTSAIIKNVFVADTKYVDRVSIEIEVEGQGDYLYGLDVDPLQIEDDSLYQEDNAFNNVLYGEHVVTVKDKNGCSLVQKTIILLEYPKFLTPNGDGNYDTWNIDNINTNEKFKAVSDILIFDRYGRIMTTIRPNGLGWDGKYNGKIVPPDDYWFIVTLKNYKGELIQKRGHFSVN